MTDDVAFLGLFEVAERIRRREITSELVTRTLIERMERHDGRLNSVLLLLADSAMSQAQLADREIAAGFWRGPLHGVPVGLKDMIWTKDQPTTGGLAFLRDFRPSEDATVVKRLKRAGAVIIAKHHTTEGATRDHHPAFGRSSNPWSAAHWTGASSSGSGVATAAGFCYGAIGTDTAGSIRVPSSANGLTGLKPTWGRVSRHGVIPLAETLDHIGPMARSAADVAALLQVIAGFDEDDLTTLAEPTPDYLAAVGQGVSDLVIGIDWTYAARDVSDEVQAALREAVAVFQDLGVRVRPVVFPLDEATAAAYQTVLDAEVCAAHADYFPEKAAYYGEGLRQRLERGAGDARTVARSYLGRTRFANRLGALFGEVDLILTPLLNGPLPTWDQFDAAAASTGRGVAGFTWPYNASGTPALAFPGGRTANGLPIGLQLAAGRLKEVDLLRAGAAFQRVTDHHTRHPRLDH